VVETDANARERVEKLFPAVSAVATLSELEILGVDAIVIATPTAEHFRIASWALERGLDVFVEKPLAASSAEARKLSSLARQNALILMVGHTFLYNRGVTMAKSVVDAGELGDVRMLNMRRTNLGPIRTDVGAVFDLAAHDLSIAAHILGEFPIRVSAFGRSWVTAGIEDVARAVFEFKGGQSVFVDVSWLYPQKIREVIVVGSQAMLRFDDLNIERPIEIYDKGLVFGDSLELLTPESTWNRTSTRSGAIVSPPVSSSEPLAEECEHFIDCLETRQNPLTDGTFGTNVVVALEAALLSMERRSAFVEISY
jgi:predicted dehydrogenase